jgi:hypothetical protein
MDTENCPTCGQPYWPPTECPDPEPLPCDAVMPVFAEDVVPIRCQLDKGHREGMHWHAAVWTGCPDLLWADDEDQAPALQPRG